MYETLDGKTANGGHDDDRDGDGLANGSTDPARLPSTPWRRGVAVAVLPSHVRSAGSVAVAVTDRAMIIIITNQGRANRREDTIV